MSDYRTLKCDAVQSGRKRGAGSLHVTGKRTASQKISDSLLSSTTRLNTHKFSVLPTQRIYVFCVDLRTKSDCFPIQHWLTGLYNWNGVCLLRGKDWVFIYNSGYVFCVDLRTNSIKWLVFITETECVYCVVRTRSLYIIQVVFCVDLRTNSDYFTIQH